MARRTALHCSTHNKTSDEKKEIIEAAERAKNEETREALKSELPESSSVKPKTGSVSSGRYVESSERAEQRSEVGCVIIDIFLFYNS